MAAAEIVPQGKKPALMEDSPFPVQMHGNVDCNGRACRARREMRAMTIRTSFASILLGLTLSLAAGPAIAAQPLVILSDQSQIITMARAPGTVVVGNPSIADVTIHGQQVFLHGRGYGTTNVIILDEAGAQLAEFEVTVQLGGGNDVATFKAGAQYSLVCAPDCEVSLHIGDQIDYYKAIANQTNTKIGLAMGQKAGESSTPAPPAQ
jgi:Flp pilus assembly secretin CpaC